MNEKPCPLLDETPSARGVHKRPVCYVNGRLLGVKWLLDYCTAHSNLGHEACPILGYTAPGALKKSPELLAREHYRRLSR